MNKSTITGPTGATAGRLFARFCRCLSVTRGDLVAAQAFAMSQPWNDAQTLGAAFKSLVEPLGTGSYAGATGPVYQDLALYLRPRTIVGKIEAMRSIPFNTRLVRGIGGTTASWTVAGEPTPVSYASYELVDALAIKKISTIAIVTAELMRNSSPKAEMAVAADVGGALAQELDTGFIDPARGETDARPASITFGAAEHESSGNTVTAIDSDLQAMIKDLVGAGHSLETATWVLHPVTATSLSLMRDASGALAYPKISVLGGELAGLKAITSTACAASGSPGEYFLALIESGEVELADDGAGELDYATQASIQMNSDPAGGAQQLVSMWQSGMVAIKGARYLNWRARRPGVASVLRGIAF